MVYFMSLIMALETYNGIVMTADRLSTICINNDKLGTVDCFPKTLNTHKLFVTKDGYGIASCGDAKLTNNYLVEQFINEEICSINFTNVEPMDVAQYIFEKIKPYNKNITFLLCGYYDSKSFAIDINFKNNEIYSYPDAARNKVLRFGDLSIPNKILNSDFHYGYNTYRLQDAIDLLVYTNQVTSKYQCFQEVLQTVSEECDVLVLFKNGEYKWININELHI